MDTVAPLYTQSRGIDSRNMLRTGTRVGNVRCICAKFNGRGNGRDNGPGNGGIIKAKNGKPVAGLSFDHAIPHGNRSCIKRLKKV